LGIRRAKIILIDFNQVATSAVLAFADEIKKKTPSESKNIIRHAILNALRSYNLKYRKDYGDMVIACDGNQYWRREFFPPYKALRKKAREESDLDWSFIHECLGEMREDLDKYFPYRVIRHPKAEADDICGILAMMTQEFGRYEPVVVVTADKDAKQLLKYDNVIQYSPMLKKQIRLTKKELREWMTEHIVKGDGGDGVPSIMSPDDFYLQEDRGRQKPISSKRLEEFVERGIDACRDDQERARYQRNRTLVDFELIPDDVRSDVIKMYEDYPVKRDLNEVFNYLVKHRCRNLLDNLQDF